MIFPSVYLASQSPRRRELLQQIGVDFAVIHTEVDETVLLNEDPHSYVLRVAIEKAQAGWNQVSQGKDIRPVLAADTSVVLGEKIFGKPVNQQQAKQMLQALSGQTHQVMTAVALADGMSVQTVISESDVTFTHLSEADIDWYLTTGESADKAGAYAVQGLAALFIEQISGSYSGIMGLPIRETGQLLMQLGDNGEQ